LLDELKKRSDLERKYMDLQGENAQLLVRISKEQVNYSNLLAETQMQKVTNHKKTVDEHLKKIDDTVQTPKRS
jgi:hypothetical protein